MSPFAGVRRLHGQGLVHFSRLWTAVAVSLGLLAAACSSAGEAPQANEGVHEAMLDVESSPFLGRWIPTSESEGLVSLTVRESALGLEVQVEGRCVPQPCVWDPFPVVLYGETIHSSRRRHALAHGRAHFATWLLSLKLRDTELRDTELNVELFTEFRDGSERANFRTEGVYVRDTAASADDTRAE